ncbi:MAG: hypothetical protein NT138_06155 [Planctomycetales bacterium]|nr:hypothetical protein [Planctomycetales bacterium]
MFGWFRKKRKSDDPAAMLAEMRRIRLHVERQTLILEGIDRDILADAASCSVSYSDCLRLVREEPSAAAMILHFTGRGWHNAAQLLNAQEADRTPVRQSDR